MPRYILATQTRLDQTRLEELVNSVPSEHCAAFEVTPDGVSVSINAINHTEAEKLIFGAMREEVNASK